MPRTGARIEPHLVAILDRLAEAVTVQDASGDLVYANERAAELLGFETPAQLLAAPRDALLAAYRVLDEHGRDFRWEELPGRRVLAGETPEPVTLQWAPRAGGERRWTVTKSSPIEDGDGRVAFAVNIMEDVTDLMRTEQEQRLLSAASKALSESLDAQHIAERAVWSVVPEVADWCSIHLPDDRGRLPAVAWAHVDHEKMAATRRWLERFAFSIADPAGVGAIMRTGRPELYPEIPSDLWAQIAQDPEHLVLMQEVGYESALGVPMVAGDRVVGVLACANAVSGRRFDARDLALAEELGRRVGVALDNARQHDERSRIAMTLQRSLLPPRLPAIPGLDLAARFRAAVEGSEVGGDFYDVFPAGYGWMVLMGDVTGKGPSAAAVTGLVRYTMRTTAHYEPYPRAVLERLNATLLSERGPRISSAVCARLEWEGRRLRARVACAGHPPPYLVRLDGRVEAVGRPGTVAGAFPEGSWHEVEVALAPGDALVFYTDGVTDARGPGERFGAARTAAALRSLAGGEADALAGGLDAAVRSFQVGPPRDDVAILAVRVDRSGA